MNTLEYGDYEATIEYEDGIFHGRILNINDVITFEGQSVRQLKAEMKVSVNDYLAWCKERGRTPDKPFSGKFVFRPGPELHAQLALEAARNNQSLNDYLLAKVKM